MDVSVDIASIFQTNKSSISDFYLGGNLNGL